MVYNIGIHSRNAPHADYPKFEEIKTINGRTLTQSESPRTLQKTPANVVVQFQVSRYMTTSTKDGRTVVGLRTSGILVM